MDFKSRSNHFIFSKKNSIQETEIYSSNLFVIKKASEQTQLNSIWFSLSIESKVYVLSLDPNRNSMINVATIKQIE